MINSVLSILAFTVILFLLWEFLRPRKSTCNTWDSVYDQLERWIAVAGVLVTLGLWKLAELLLRLITPLL